MALPNLEQIDRIAALGDPVLRNLHITQTYSELSDGICGFLGFSANWCTFATWASKQAGQTIRQEDILRAFETAFDLSPEITTSLDELKLRLRSVGAKLPVRLTRETILSVLNPRAAFDRASDAVARGNKKVFEEIGREFARFIEYSHEDDHFDGGRVARFCAGLRPGDPPNGQRLLAEAFTAYSAAHFRSGKEKAELILLANLCAGCHEQVRLQPEITEALNAALSESVELKEKLRSLVLPAFYLRARARVLGSHQSILDNLFDRLIGEVNRLIRQVITDHLMTLRLSGTETLHLGRKLEGPFPQALERIDNPRLREILAFVDPTPNSLDESSAEDWANFADRMHFIADFFRIYQEQRYLFDAPFTNGQVTLLKSGTLPSAPL